jgi:hypothetical protein
LLKKNKIINCRECSVTIKNLKKKLNITTFWKKSELIKSKIINSYHEESWKAVKIAKKTPQQQISLQI